MRNTEKKGAAAPKLTAEEQQILEIVKQSRYSARQLQTLMWYCRAVNLLEMSDDIQMCIGMLLCSTEDIDKEEIGAVAKIFGFSRTLIDISRM